MCGGGCQRVPGRLLSKKRVSRGLRDGRRVQRDIPVIDAVRDGPCKIGRIAKGIAERDCATVLEIWFHIWNVAEIRFIDCRKVIRNQVIPSEV